MTDTEQPGAPRQGNGRQQAPHAPQPEPPTASAPQPAITADDLARVDWQGPVSDDAIVRDLHPIFYQHADAARASSKESDAAVFDALGHACSLHRQGDPAHQPFTPWLQLPTGRSAALDDIAPDTARALGAAAVTTRNVRLRARMADVAWARARDHTAARTAVGAYLDIARLEAAPENWPNMLRALERATQIATSLGRGDSCVTAVREIIEELLAGAGPAGDGFRSAKLLELLIEFDDIDAAKYSALAVALFQEWEAALDWDCARAYGDVAVRFAKLRKDPYATRELRLQIAEMYATEAEELLADASASRLNAAIFLQRAIEAMRRAGAGKARIEALHTHLLEVQRQSVSELHPISHEMDLSESVARTTRAFAGHTLPDALVHFASLQLVPKLETLRRNAEEQVEQHPLLHMTPRMTVDSAGRMIARGASARSTDADEREAVIRAEMVRDTALHFDVAAVGTIRPARAMIRREHALRVDHLMEFAAYHPLMDAGREPLVAEGLFAGFTGDMPKALHLLLPQMEHLIRQLLARSGITVTSIDNLMLQEHHNLNRLLFEPKLKELLGDDLVFTLQALLAEKVGPDLRNKMAHGQLDFDTCFGGPAVAVWWLMFRLIAAPLVNEVVRRPESGAEPDSQ